jgi:hypothetical protein
MRNEEGEIRSTVDRTQELFDFLQGEVPENCRIDPARVPRLSSDQAWTVIWYLGNQYWQVTDHIERCGVCGDLFDTHSGGDCLDYGKPPYHFCENCCWGPEYAAKKEASDDP